MKKTTNATNNLVNERDGFQLGTVPADKIIITRKDELIRKARTYLYGEELVGDKFDYEKVTPLAVLDQGDGTYRLIDGYRRLRGLQSNGYTDIPVRVHPVQENPDAYVIRGYITQDAGEKWVTNRQKHEGKKFFGDKEAFAIDNVFTKYGIMVDESIGAHQAGYWGYHKSAETICKTAGQDGLEWIVSIMVKAGWDKKPDGLDGKLTYAIFDLYMKYTEERQKMADGLAKYLKTTCPENLKADAKAYAIGNVSRSVYKYFFERVLTDMGILNVPPRKDIETALEEIATRNEITLQEAGELTGLSTATLTVRLKARGFRRISSKFFK